MRKVNLILLAAVAIYLLAAPLALGQGGKDGNVEEQVHNLCKSLNQALVKADVPTLNKIFADEFIIIRPNGTVVDKVEAVKDVESRKTKFESIEELDSKVHIYGNTGLVTTLEKAVTHSVVRRVTPMCALSATVSGS